MGPGLCKNQKRLIAYRGGPCPDHNAAASGRRPRKLTILPRAGGIGGFARTTPDEEILDSGLISRAYLQARLVVAMGGRAASWWCSAPQKSPKAPATCKW